MDASQLIESADIVEYISQFCELEEKNGEYWGLSPFKDEKTPSFSVNPHKRNFYDFSTGKGGNVIEFIKEYKKCDVHKAILELRAYLGITSEDYNATAKPPIIKIAKKYGVKRPPNERMTAEILPDNYMSQYEDRKDKLAVWVNEGILPEVLEKFQVKYDAFTNRLVYPVRNYNGKIVNVCGRTLDENFKEKGLRKYTYFKKWGSMDVIFGLSENMESIIEQKQVILYEGAKSVFLADGYGFKNTAALLTSHLGKNQLIALIKLGVEVVFALDEEINPREDKNIQKLKRYCKVTMIHNKEKLLKPKMSPTDAGKEIWERLYKTRKEI